MKKYDSSLFQLGVIILKVRSGREQSKNIPQESLSTGGGEEMSEDWRSRWMRCGEGF